VLCSSGPNSITTAKSSAGLQRSSRSSPWRRLFWRQLPLTFCANRLELSATILMSALPQKRTFVDWRLRAKGGNGIMKAFVFACIAAVVIAIIGAIVLGGMQESADHAFSSSAVRLGP
jgi:hypothetical protein